MTGLYNTVDNLVIVTTTKVSEHTSQPDQVTSLFGNDRKRGDDAAIDAFHDWQSEQHNLRTSQLLCL